MDYFSITPKNWESDFFNIKYYHLSIEKLDENISTAIYDLDFDILECNVNTQNFSQIYFLEKLGFKSVGSRITFLTEINLSEDRFFFESKDYIIRPFENIDLESIVEMTHTYLSDNPNFVSRYKNLDYFESDMARKYFEKWIRFSVENEKSSTIVAVKENEVVGFFITQEKGKKDKLPLMKGILTAVKKAHRGQNLHLAMQSELYFQLKIRSFYLDNTTQLSNIPVIKNHIKSKRELDCIMMTMMLSRKHLIKFEKFSTYDK